MRPASLLLSAINASLLHCACGGDESTQDNSNANSKYGSSTNTATTPVDNIKRNPAQVAITGGARFTKDGTGINLSHIPAGRVFYTSVASQITFHASEDSKESLSRDGVQTGRFGETPLRGAGQDGIVLDNGEFTVQLTSPW